MPTPDGNNVDLPVPWTSYPQTSSIIHYQVLAAWYVKLIDQYSRGLMKSQEERQRLGLLRAELL